MEQSKETSNLINNKMYAKNWQNRLNLCGMISLKCVEAKFTVIFLQTNQQCRLNKLFESVQRTSLIFDYCNKAMDQIVQGQINGQGCFKGMKRKVMKSNLYNAFRKPSSLSYARIVTSPINESLK